MGLRSYYRCFVFSFCRIATPLTKVMKNDEAFIWDADQWETFQHQKNRFVTIPVLSYFDKNAATEVHTEATLEAVVVQTQEGVKRVINR